MVMVRLAAGYASLPALMGAPRQHAPPRWHVQCAVPSGRLCRALDILEKRGERRYLTNDEEGQLRGEVAHAYFILGLTLKR